MCCRKSIPCFKWQTLALQRFLFSSPSPSRKTNMETFPEYLSISSTENKWSFYLSWFGLKILEIMFPLPPPKMLFFSLLSLYLVFLFTSKEVHRICSSPDYFLVLFGFPFSWSSFLNISIFLTSFFKCLNYSVFDILFYCYFLYSSKSAYMFWTI